MDDAVIDAIFISAGLLVVIVIAAWIIVDVLKTEGVE